MCLELLTFPVILHFLKTVGTSFAVQWLRLHLAMQEVRIQGLVREPRSHTMCLLAKTAKQNRNDIVTNQVKTLKMEVGGSFKRERTYVHLWLIHADVWQKPDQYCKAIILQLKINTF